MSDLIPVYQDPFDLAERIAKSALIPQAYRGKPADAAICMMYGAEVGLPPMTALQRIIVINGKPTLDAQGMAALIRGAGHSIVGKTSNEEAIVTGRRKDNGDEMTVTFTMADAKRANLVKNGPWTQYPSSMLWARAVSKLARELFPDVLMGMSYVPEEMGEVAGVVVDGPEPPTREEAIDIHPSSLPADESTGEIVDAEVVTEVAHERVDVSPPSEPVVDPLKEAKDQLGVLIKSMPPNQQAGIRGELTELFGPSPKMDLAVAQTAIEYVAGWPATRADGGEGADF